MGAVGTAAAVTGAYSQYETFKNGRKHSKQELESINRQRQYNMKSKQNILDGQLAKRRSQIAAMGMSSSGSAEAVAQGMIERGYQDINQDNSEYDRKYEKLYDQRENDFNRLLLQTSTGVANKVLK